MFLGIVIVGAVFNIFVILTINADTCTTYFGRKAECISLRTCPTMNEGIFKLDPSAVDYARKSICKIENNETFVCCGLCGLSKNGEEIGCIPLKECAHIVDNLLSLDKDLIDQAKKAVCKVQNDEVHVCCDYNSKVEVVVPVSEKTSIKNLTSTENVDRDLPNDRICGFQHSDYRIRNSNTINSDDFPWLVLLMYEINDGTTKPFCTGALISHRHVVTAASCLEKVQNLKFVRLGDFNLKTNPDCEYIKELNFTYCGEDVIDNPVKNYVTHQNYSFDEHGTFNDIAVLQLKKYVEFTEYVRAICLPNKDDDLRKIGKMLYTSGWGSFVDNKPGWFDIKKKTIGTLVPTTECVSNYNSSVQESYLCLREGANASCIYDSGGPLMSSNKLQFYLEGIFIGYPGNNFCKEGNTGIYTKVVQYVEWIKSTVVEL